MKKENLIATFYFSCIFYCIGALVIENDVNYPTWHYIGEDQFNTYHSTLESLLMKYLFFPLTLSLGLHFYMIFSVKMLPIRLLLVSSLVLLILILSVSIFMQVPVHQQIQQSYSRELVEKLIENHRSFRLIPTILWAVVNCWLLNKFFRPIQNIKYLQRR